MRVSHDSGPMVTLGTKTSCNRELVAHHLSLLYLSQTHTTTLFHSTEHHHQTWRINLASVPHAIDVVLEKQSAMEIFLVLTA